MMNFRVSLSKRLFLICVSLFIATFATQGISYGQVCQVGDVLGPGESCAYPGTGQRFTVGANGRGQFGFSSSGTRLTFTNSTINGVSYNFVASKRADGNWVIEEVGNQTAPPPPPSEELIATLTGHADLESPHGIALDVAAGKMYWTDWGAHTIQRANLDGSQVETLVDAGLDLRSPHGIALDVAAGKMYWTDHFTAKIQRANLDGSSVEDLIAGLHGEPSSLALDTTGRKMYWTDYRTHKIQRANLDGSQVETLVSTGLVFPYSLALDVAAGKMYWTNDAASPSRIQRANLDGSQVETLVEQPFANVYALALDVAAGKIYWTNGWGIQRANLDGSLPEDLGVDARFSSPFGIALDVSGGKMYWTDYRTHKIQRANLDGSLAETLVEPPPPDKGYDDVPPQLFLDYSVPDPDGGATVKTGPSSQARIRVGEEITLSVLVKCDDGKIYAAGRYDAPCFTGADQVTYRSSAPSAATVTLGYTDYFGHEAAGIVRGVGLGASTITATFKGRDTAPVTVEVVSASPIAERVTMDRPDDISGPQIHFVYAVHIGENDRNYDRTGDIAAIADMMQNWLQDQAGMKWRLDTYNGQLDVSYLPIRYEGGYAIMPTLEKALQAQRQRHPEKIYAVFFDSPFWGTGGLASGKIAYTGVAGPYHETIAGTAIHEILHTFGAVPSCAPNGNSVAHVTDGGRDIMGGTAGSVGGGPDWVSVLDSGRDDYFGHGRSDCLDVADSPYWTAAAQIPENRPPEAVGVLAPEDAPLLGDVNADGAVNVQDLVLVANSLGKTGENVADVNNDGQVNVQDLVLVAGNLGDAAAAPAAWKHTLTGTLTRADVEQWLSEARQLAHTDLTSQRGVLFLESLLLAFTPQETALLANYPNPFNPETWIPYQLSKSAEVSVSIYSVEGVLIRTLALGHQSTGTYQSRSRAAYWDGRNAFGEPVASGVYFYTLSAGDFVATRRMLILK